MRVADLLAFFGGRRLLHLLAELVAFLRRQEIARTDGLGSGRRGRRRARPGAGCWAAAVPAIAAMAHAISVWRSVRGVNMVSFLCNR